MHGIAEADGPWVGREHQFCLLCLAIVVDEVEGIHLTLDARYRLLATGCLQLVDANVCQVRHRGLCHATKHGHGLLYINHHNLAIVVGDDIQALFVGQHIAALFLRYIYP